MNIQKKEDHIYYKEGPVYIGNKYDFLLTDGSIVENAKLIIIRTGLDKWTNTSGYEFIIDTGDNDLLLAVDILNVIPM